MSKIYIVSVIVSLMIIVIITFNRNRKYNNVDELLFPFIIKLYFAIIPILNLIIAFGLLYVSIEEIIHTNDLKKDF